MPLTAIQVRNCRPANRTRKLTDSRGMYLEIPPQGNKRWRLRYRFQGREKLISLGVYPDVSLKEARDYREEARKLLREGIDPSADRKARRAAAHLSAGNTFEVIAGEWLERHGSRWAPSHRSKVVGRLKRHVLPWLGRCPITDIETSELIEVAHRIADRGAVETAHRVLQSCSQIFRYAIATGRARHNPTPKPGDVLESAQPESMAATLDPERLGALLRAVDGYQGSLVVSSALRLAPLVFVRPGELRHAAWEDIRREKAEWHFTASKTHREHIVPLARQALVILDEIRPLTGAGRYVFPSARAPQGDRPMSENALLMALRSLGIPKEEMSIHGWRAVARTLLDQELHYREDYIEHQLAHKVRDPNGRAYNRATYLEARRWMMQRWADYLDALKQPTPHAEGLGAANEAGGQQRLGRLGNGADGDQALRELLVRQVEALDTESVRQLVQALGELLAPHRLEQKNSP